MSLFLALLPREIIEQITRRLSATDDFQLYCCGDLVLNTKLQTGGILVLRFQDRHLPMSALKFFQSLSISSCSITRDVCEHVAQDTLKILVQGLSSKLRRLKCGMAFASTLERDDWTCSAKSATSPSISSHERAVWLVRDSYPVLQTLNILDYSQSTDKGPIYHAEFLHGLPASITSLSLPSLDATPSIDYLRLLPPHLHDLTASLLPTRTHQKLETLLSLKLNLQRFSPQRSANPDHFQLGHLTLPALESLYIPQGLQRLDMTFFDFAHLQWLVMPQIPPTLLTLSLNSAADTLMDWKSLKKELLCFIPKSVTDLTLNLNLRPRKSSDSIAAPAFQPNASFGVSQVNRLTLPAVKKFSIGFGSMDAASESQFFLGLIHILPSVESFEIRSPMTKSALGLEELALFNGTCLRSLTAPLSAECFPEAGPYPLAAMFPNLRELALIGNSCWPRSEESAEHIDINFDAIPPSVTSFHAHQHLLVASKKYLHLLEPFQGYTTTCRLYLKFSRNLYRFCHITDLSRPETSDNSDSSLIRTSGKKLEVKLPGMHFQLKKKEKIDSIATAPHDPKAAQSEYTLEHDTGADFPTDITEFSIRHDSDYIFASGIGRINALAPTLTKLDLSDCSIEGEKVLFGNFEALTDLSMCYARFDRCPCPPNLTRLSIKYDEVNALLPLSKTLTELACVDPDPKIISSLPRLQVLKIRANPFSTSPGEILLPATITELRCHADWLNERSCSILFQLAALPHPTKLKVKGQVSHSIVNILSNLPTHVTLDATGCIGRGLILDIATVFQRAGIELITTSTILSQDTLVSLFQNAFHRAYHHIGGLPTPPRDVFERVLDWASVIPLLPQSTQLLHLKSVCFENINTCPIQWPQNLTTLKIEKIKVVPSSEELWLPESLTSLSIDGKVLSRSRGLPKRLTSLNLGQHMMQFVITWPPQLTSLTASFLNSVQEASVKTLPPTLAYLDIGWLHAVEYALHFPAGLKQFNGAITGPESAILLFAELAIQRGFFWVVPWANLSAAHRKALVNPSIFSGLEALALTPASS